MKSLIHSFLFGHSRTLSSDDLRLRLNWLIRWRWFALVIQIISMPAMYFIFKWPESQLISYLSTLLYLIFANFFCYTAVKFKQLKQHFLLLPLMVDLFQICFLFHLMQVDARPLYPLIFVQVAVAGITLQGRSRLIYLFYLLTWIVLIFKPWIPTWNEKFSFVSFFIVATVLWGALGLMLQMLGALEDQLIRAIDKKRRVDRLQLMGAMASGFAHQFSTPLNTLKLRLNRLVKIDQVEQSPDYLRSLDSLVQCEKALRDFMEHSWRTDHLNIESVNLESWILEFILNWKKQHSHVQVDENILIDETLKIQIPSRLFSEALSNILNNCVGFSRVTVELKKIEKNIEFVITDNGPGFPASVIERFGEPYITTKIDGTGLGLFNTYNLVKLLNGEMAISNNLESGARVWIQIPNEVSDE